MAKEIRYILVGLGNIGRNLLDILMHRQKNIEAQYDLTFKLVAAVDSAGAAVDPRGLDPALVRDLKLARRKAAEYTGAGRLGMSALEVVSTTAADLFVDASPTSLVDGEPGLSCTRVAFERGMNVVAANKGPLVLAFAELTTRARELGLKLHYSGTVAGGLPTVNIGVRDLAGSGVTRVEGIFNGTTNYILTRMAEEHIDYATALQGAQEAGIAEADPTLDVDGWDAANKLVIIANSVLRRPTKLADVAVEGIRGVTLADLDRAQAQGQALRLLAVAGQQGDDYALSVRPTALPLAHPLGRIGRWDMGVVYYTDFMGTVSAVIEEKGPVPTSAAVLRDMINVYAGGS